MMIKTNFDFEHRIYEAHQTDGDERQIVFVADNLAQSREIAENYFGVAEPYIEVTVPTNITYGEVQIFEI